ncbi:integrator complex subunit 3 homolog [Anthonomus grandis grandis]|uniref:integrator complex subunit 3 homolog n=1 Tax=Anthonomus grandis grandis TaxID=2921223 RepID=UPI00216626A7|nr:integrator complex subunit 3 homolog [Anthonomus grandis grandis]
METMSAGPNKLFLTSPVENKDDTEEKFLRSYQFLQGIRGDLSDKDAHEALNKALLKDKGYEEVSLGLLVSILIEPHNAARSYRDLTLITRDGFGHVVTSLSQLVFEKYLRFTEVVKQQLVWFLREMIKNNVSNVDNLCWNLMRHAAGGDISPRNLSLVESLLDVYIEYISWLVKFPILIASVVYTYLRLIEDHHAPFLASLRQKEVNFLIGLIREHFDECLVIGRDLVRLLQNVARIPEFEQLWRDLLMAPKSLSPNFTGILQLLQNRTSRRFLQSRLTPEMEKKLVFLTSHVRFGHHKRYQDWFQRQYLATPESQSLRCDIIRFIVGVIHPTNELLCSDIIPRWAVIGWLLTTCTSNVAMSNAKLALFYDWLFYDVEKDNIMNIEPAILVMHHSMRSHPAVTATLLDFLCRIITNFYPPLTERVRSGIFSSLRQILDKRVLPSLVPLFDNSKLDRELRNMVKDMFKEFCTESANLPSSTSREEFNNTNKFEEESVGISLSNHLLDGEPAFSDDEDEPELKIANIEDDTDDDDIPLSKVRLKEKSDKSDESLIEGPLGDLLAKLQEETDPRKRCDLAEEIVAELTDLDVNKNQNDVETLCACARTFAACVADDLRCDRVFPETTPSIENLTASVRSPLFVVLQTVYGYTNSRDDQLNKSVLIRFLAEMHPQLPTLGYYILYFLKVQIRTENKRDDNTKASALKIALYKEFCNCIEKKLDQCLYDDLNACHVTDTKLMMWLVPDLYRDFKQQMVNNAQALRVIISAIDTRQLQTLVGKVLQGHLVMFKTENLQNLLKATLAWESIEQIFFWQLINAHDVTIDTVMPLITELDYDQHPEALTAVMLMLKQEKPNADYIKCLFSRDICDNGDLFIFTVIKYWCDDYIDKVAELISALLSTRYPSTSPNKRKRTANAGNKVLSTTVPSADQVLGHLEKLRIICEKHDCMAIYTLDSMQRALGVAQSNSNDSQRKQFGELFALMEEEEEISATKSRLQGRGRKPPASKPAAPSVAAAKRQIARDLTDSSEETSEEEEIVKPKQAKKRKKVLSESD